MIDRRVAPCPPPHEGNTSLSTIQVKAPTMADLINQGMARLQKSLESNKKNTDNDEVTGEAPEGETKSINVITDRRKRLHAERQQVLMNSGMEFDEADASLARYHANPDDEDIREVFGKMTTVKAFLRRFNETPAKPDNYRHVSAEQVARFQDLNDAILLKSALTGLRGSQMKQFEEYGRYRDMFKFLARTEYKAMYGGGSSDQGEDVLPTNFSSQVIEKVRLANIVPNQFRNITMTSRTYNLPLEGVDIEAGYVAENGSDNPYDLATYDAAEPVTAVPRATPTVVNIQLVAKKLALATLWAEEWEQDAIINGIDYIRDKLAKGFAIGRENAVINGDTAMTSGGAGQDGGKDWKQNGATAIPKSWVGKAWDGLRKKALAGTAKIDIGGTNDVTLSDIRNLLALMDIYAIDPSDLLLICGSKVYQTQLKKLAEYQTADKTGGAGTAVAMTGRLKEIDGIPIFVTQNMPQNLNASGVYDNVTKTKSAIIVVNKTQFVMGDRQLMQVKAFDNPYTDQKTILMKQRADFKQVETAAVVGILYNVHT